MLIYTRFGYVEYAEPEQSEVAIQRLDQQIFEGRKLTVQYSVRKEQPQRPRVALRTNPPTKTLFIGNMSFDMSDRDLNELFREIHNVIDVRVAIDRKTGQPRGFAHADFIDVRSAQKAFDVLNNRDVHGRRLRVDYSQPSYNQQQRGQTDSASTAGSDQLDG